MEKFDEKIPDPKELEKEIGEFLTKKFGDNVKLVSPIVLPEEEVLGKDKQVSGKKRKINFDLLPEELVAYLDQYIVKQDHAKAVLATKICTHFNRIKKQQGQSSDDAGSLVGSIKSNVLMIGPTGVGKTYMVKLIARKIGVPFVKGDATKFSETGYVGGDVEDLIRDLVREADDDIELAQHGIIYIDEIDKIASSQNLIGADVSRTGVQRALLKPMEETEVELKVPHDPISMLKEIERFRKSGERENRTVNTKNILFIMSGAFEELSDIVKKRMTKQSIGFSAQISNQNKAFDTLKHVKSEDLISFGFESEFVGRLPIRAVFERLDEKDLYTILKNPNNPIVVGKKLDFAAYGINAKFDDKALKLLAKLANSENTGARGLVSAIEDTLLLFEKRLPSTDIKIFPITGSIIDQPEKVLNNLSTVLSKENAGESFDRILKQEKAFIKEYITANQKHLESMHSINLSSGRIDNISEYYSLNASDVGSAIRKIKFYYDETKKIELAFFQIQDMNIILEDDAADFIIQQFIKGSITDIEQVIEKLTKDFKYGFKLVRKETGRNRFFVNKMALISPEEYISNLLKQGRGPKEETVKNRPLIDGVLPADDD